MFVIMVIRLHFLLAVSNYYSHLARHHHRNPSCLPSPSSSCLTNSILSTTPSTGSHSLHPDLNSSSVASPTITTGLPMPMQRIFVLPSTTANTSFNSDIENGGLNADGVELIYAPVPRHTLPKELQDQATEAWIPSSSSTSTRAHRHHHRRHHLHAHGRHSRSRSSRSESRETTGRIKLNISPDEGLLPAYGDAYDRKA